jgi:secernin
MGSDMVVALGRATVDGHTLFGHNNNRPHGEGQSLARVPGRGFAPGESVRATHVDVPQVRQTFTALGCRSGAEWGYQHGVNEKGVAVGVTAIRTRLANEGPGLTGPDLVRLALERAASASQGVEVLADLVHRHGQGAFPGGDGEPDSSFLVADGREAYVLEACGPHWALQQVGRVRAVSAVCQLRQDWDRISRGLADAAIARGWWPENGSKLDFAAAVGREGPDRAGCMRRWGKATLELEQHSGQVDESMVRRLLDALAEAGRPGAPATASSLVVRLGEGAGEVPLAWCSFGPPGAGVFFPVPLAAELPGALRDEGGAGCPLWQRVARLHADARRDPRLRGGLRSALAGLQQHFDQTAREFTAEASALVGRGAGEELRRLAGSFVQHNLECWESAESGLRPRGPSGPHRVVVREDDPIYTWMGG